MANKNVMPVLPPRNNPQQNQPNRQNKSGNQQPGKVNVKALVIFGVVVIGIIVLIVVRNCAGTKPVIEDSSDSEYMESLPAYSEPEESSYDPSTNSGTEYPVEDLAAVFKDNSRYVFVTDVDFTNKVNVADETAIVVDTYLSLRPTEQCVYRFATNEVTITHANGSMVDIKRSYYKSDDAYGSDNNKQFTYDLLVKNANANSVIQPTYGDVYLGTDWAGKYVKGYLTVIKEKEETEEENSEMESTDSETSDDSEPSTGSDEETTEDSEVEETIETEEVPFILAYIFSSEEVYTVSLFYNTQDTQEVLFNTILMNKSQLRLN